MPDESESRDPRATRRRFCQVAGIGACATAVGGATALGIDFLRPRALLEPPTTFRLGLPDSFDVETVATSEVHHAYVIRRADGFRAMSSVCTHLGCITRYAPDDGIIACPCHGSRFSLDGEVLAGPAPRPLPWFQIDLTSKGEILVDTSIEVAQGKVFKL